MNKKTIAGLSLMVVLIASIGVITAVKTTLGDKATELPGEEEMEKTLNLQESNEYGESAEDEAREYGGG